MSDFKKILQQGKELQRRAERLGLWMDKAPTPKSEAVCVDAPATRREPFLTLSGDLIIPMESDSRYHWWRNGQSILQTLMELGANEDILDRYVWNWRSKIAKKELN